MQKYDMKEAEENLLNKIINRKDIFKTLFVIVPNKTVGDAFKEYFINNSSSVLMNVKFITFNSFLTELIKTKKLNILTKDLYKMFIVDSLMNDDINDEKVEKYLNKDNSDYDKKLYDLTNTFYDLFIDYENCLFKPTGYEALLFKRVKINALNYNLCMKSYLLDDDVLFNDLGEVIFFGFLKHTAFEEKIMEKYKNYIEFNIKKDEVYDKIDTKINPIINAITKDKEVEVLHSKIAGILLNNGVKYSDILVLAPNINSYEAKIKQVFEQDGVNYPKIRYNILSANNKESDTYRVLNVLQRALRNEYTFSRLDFADLLNQTIIKEKYMIDQYDVKDFIQIILKLNVYNNIDFDYLKKRLILSLVADPNDEDNKKVLVGDNLYYAYKEIFLDNDNILKIVKIIDSVESYINIIKNTKTVSISESNKIFNAIKNLVYIESVDNKELTKISNFIYNYNVIGINMPTKLFMDFIYDLIKNTKDAHYDTSGITFRSFSKDYVTPAKYTFFIGFTSEELPVKKVKQELDLRDYDINLEEIDDMKNALITQYQNSEYFYTSYVSKNLKAEADLFVSLFAKELYITEIDKNGKPCFKEQKYGLDENRNVEELYTKREFKNKGYNLNNINHDTPKCDFSNSVLKEKDIKIKTKNMASFLNEPFSAKANNVFPYEREEQEQLSEEYESFNIDNITNSQIISELAKIIIENDLSLEDVCSDKLIKIKEKYKLEKKIPTINKEIFNALFASKYIDAYNIKKLIIDYPNIDKSISRLEPLTLKNKDNLWVLECDKEFIKIIDNDTNIYVELKEVKDDCEIKNYLHLYVLSLQDVAGMNDDNLYSIKLLRSTKSNYCYKITPSDARTVLNKIYDAMQDYNDIFFFDAKDLEIEEDKIKNTFNEYIDSKLSDFGPWTYFKDKKMFDNDDLGYEKDSSFKNEFLKYQQKMRELILITKE